MSVSCSGWECSGSWVGRAGFSEDMDPQCGWALQSRREARLPKLLTALPWLVLGAGAYSGRCQLQVLDGNLKVGLTLISVS